MRVTHTVTSEGLLVVTVAPATGAMPVSGAGVLLVLEVEALSNGVDALGFGAEDVHLVATDGRKVIVKASAERVSVGR
jgi:hypothetical protein